MSREDDIKTLTEDIIPSSSEEEGEKEEIEKEMHEETQNIQTKEEQETEEEQKEEEKLDKPTVIPKAEKKTASKTEKRKRTKIEKKKPKKAQKKIATGEAGTQQKKDKTLPEIEETQAKTANIEKIAEDEGEE